MTNKQVERKVVEAIDKGFNTFGEIRDRLALSDRQLDNALRRLKNAGEVHFDNLYKVWRARAVSNSMPISAQSNVTHFGLLIDMSGSMSGFGTRVDEAVRQNLEAVRAAAQGFNQKSTLSVFTFSEKGNYERFSVKFLGVDGDGEIPKVQFNPWGNTPLYDSIEESINKMSNLGSPQDSKVLLVVTDGAENSSTRNTTGSIRQLITKTNGDDTWTFAAFCPPMGVNAMLRIGFAKGNIRSWDSANLEKELVTRSTVSSTRYMHSRSKGVKSNKTDYFVTDLSHLDNRVLRNKLKDLKTRFKVTTVPKEVGIREFIEQKTGCFIPGTVFFQLTKPEKLSSQKEILIKEKGTNSIYGGRDARTLIGLPESGSWKDVKIKPGNHANYDIYLQSTSHNRKLVRGTEVIYMP